MQDSISRVNLVRSHSVSASQTPSTSIQYDSDGHAKSLPADLAAWAKQIKLQTEVLLTTYESQIYSSNKEISGFSYYAADELRYHIRRLEKLLSID